MSHPREILGKDVWSIVMDYMHDDRRFIEWKKRRLNECVLDNQWIFKKGFKGENKCWRCKKYKSINKNWWDPNIHDNCKYVEDNAFFVAVVKFENHWTYKYVVLIDTIFVLFLITRFLYKKIFA
jgi:hypothetical protein